MARRGSNLMALNQDYVVDAAVLQAKQHPYYLTFSSKDLGFYMPNSVIHLWSH
jgi:hypothetical protein